MGKETKNGESECKKKDSVDELLKYSAFGFAAIGIIVIVVFLIIIANKFSIGSKTLDMSVTGQVGDFIGGLVGSMWAFAGVILFFLALRLQRKEFASQTEQLSLQKDELRLQRQELKNQRQEFRIGRITNIIYKQKEIIDSRIKDLHLSVHRKEIDRKGIAAIANFGTWANTCIPKGKPLKKFTENETKDFQNFNSFLMSNSFKDYMNSLKNSIDLCVKLIGQKDSEGNSLNEYDIMNLMFLLLKNFDLEKIRLMLSEIRRMHEIQLEQAEGNSASDENYIEYFNQEISEYKVLLENIGLIKKCSKGTGKK